MILSCFSARLIIESNKSPKIVLPLFSNEEKGFQALSKPDVIGTGLLEQNGSLGGRHRQCSMEQAFVIHRKPRWFDALVCRSISAEWPVKASRKLKNLRTTRIHWPKTALHQ
jgi:hypothetical protein